MPPRRRYGRSRRRARRALAVGSLALAAAAASQVPASLWTWGRSLPADSRSEAAFAGSLRSLRRLPRCGASSARAAEGPIKAALEELRSVGEGVEDQWQPLLGRMEDKMRPLQPLLGRMESKLLRIDEGLERAQEKAVTLEKSHYLVPLIEFFLALCLIGCVFVLMYLLAVSAQLRSQSASNNSKRQSEDNSRNTVLRALGIPLERPKPEAKVRDAVLSALCFFFPLSAETDEPSPGTYSMEVLDEMREYDSPSGAMMGALETWDVRIRQRARTGAVRTSAAADNGPASGVPAASPELRAVLPETPPSAEHLPARAAKAWDLLQESFSNPDDRRALLAALHAACAALPSPRWTFKEAILKSLVRLGTDARAITALLLHDLDDCLGLPWATVSQSVAACEVLGDEVVGVITEKKRLEQLGLLLYLRAMAQQPTSSNEWVAAMQLTRLLYLQRSQDFRAALVEITEVEYMLREIAKQAANSRFQLPIECWALARCVLDLYAPLAHGLGLDALVAPGRNERLTPSLEQLALRLHFPDEYRMIEDWMLQEDQLLDRTLRRCIWEMRKALERDDDLSALATFRVNGRVKSVYSLVKKLLRQRGVPRADLKAEAVKDLLALEVVVTPDQQAVVPENPEWLAEEWRERAACFAALGALQQYARETKGWWIMPGSTKDYITKSKKSGYRALHITLTTNVHTLLPKASSRAVAQARPETTMPCKLEVHIFSASMKQKEQAGSASHHLYKAFELTSEEVFSSLSKGGTAGKLKPSEIRRQVFPAERMCLFGDVFSAGYVDAELEELCSTSDRDRDGLLSFSDVRRAQRRVAGKLEDFRLALKHRQQHWWVTGVHAPTLAPSKVYGMPPDSLSLQEKVRVLDRALRITKDAHRGQVRKSGEPYWTHPLSVADILARLLLPPNPTTPPELPDGCDIAALEADARALWHRVAAAPEDVFAMYIAALLHDTVEDTSMTILQIQTMFGHTVASLVDGVTKATSESASRATRSARDLRKVLERAARDVRVLVIKFADRLHNMRTLGHMPPAKQRRIAEETRAAFVPLADRLGIHVWKTELEELCCRYLNGYAYKLTHQKNDVTVVARQRNLRYIQQYFSTLIVDWMSDGAIQDLSMEEEPVHTQLRRWAARPGGSPPTPVPRMKVVTKDRDMCWSILGRIHALLPPMPGRIRDYISSPKENLYHCLHTAVLMDGAPVEIYIKSVEMDWVAEFGVGAYWRHNEELQRSDMGRVLQEALRSTWLREANDSLEQTLRTVKAASVDGDEGAASAEGHQQEGEHTWREEDVLQPDIGPLMEHVIRVAYGCRSAGTPDPGAGSAGSSCVEAAAAVERYSVEGGGQLGSVHRAYSEALREKVTVFTPTGRVVYLPRDATALDFAVWNLGARKGLRAESAFIDGSPASLHTKLCEGQTVLVHLRADASALPRREWAGVHLRYLRTARARAALVDIRNELLTTEEAVEEGRSAMRSEVLLHSLDLSLLEQLGDEVLAAVGRGALPAELVSAQLLAVRLGLTLGDPDFEYAADSYYSSEQSAMDTSVPQSETSSEEPPMLSFMLVAKDRPNLMWDVVEMVRQHGCNMTRMHAEPRGEDCCLIVASVNLDTALRFGSLMHSVRYSAEPLLLQRVPVELGAPPTAGQPRAPLGPWLNEVPPGLSGAPLVAWKLEALGLASEPRPPSVEAGSERQPLNCL